MNLQEIIQSGYKGSIVECGHGAELANDFLSQPGASEFILRCVQPYSKEIQFDMYDLQFQTNLRSVSARFVNLVAAKELKSIMKYTNKGLSIVTSFQLDNGNSLTHGYMAIATCEGGIHTTKIYHFSFYRNGKYDTTTRKTAWITLIKRELLNVIYNYLTGKDVKSDYIDGVFDSLDKTGSFWNGELFKQNIAETIKANQTTTKPVGRTNDNILCFTPDRKFHRFEDMIRHNTNQDDRGIILQKGSYNPLHRMHKKIAEDARSKYTTYPHALVLSMNSCDKGYNDENVLSERIESILNAGYSVIVTKSGMFLDNINRIREHYAQDKLRVVFPVGEDTMERFFRDWEDHFNKIPAYIIMKYSSYKHSFNNVEWYITKRISETKNFGELIPKYQEVLPNFVYSDLEMDDISSTAIRTGKLKNE